MSVFYRPQWTCGRYHKTISNSYALFYNLIEGMVFFFEDESADILGAILQIPKKSLVPVSVLQKSTNNLFTSDEIINFCNELVEKGLLTEGLLSEEVLTKNRKQIGEFRRNQAITVEKSIIEKLPFKQEEAENIYLDILEKSRVPFVVMFELTYNCNESCIHCYNPGAARNENDKSERNNRNEIDIAHYEKLLDELKQLGVVKIILTGGDPFVKKDIWRLIELIYDRDFAMDIYTNGQSLINRTERLASFYPRSVGLSVYSSENDIHDSITQVKGSLRKTLDVAEYLTQYGVPLYFKCPIMKNNATSYFKVTELAKYYGAIPQIDISLTDGVDGDNSISENLQVDSELLEIILRDPNIPLYVGKEAPNYGSQVRDRNQPFCGAGTVLMNITPEGDITPCNSFPTQFGNLKEKSFTEIWNTSQSLKAWQQIVINDYDECGTHERCGYCNRCPGQSYIEHGNPLNASSANCCISNARMNLAKKLKNGQDTLEGQTLEEQLRKVKIEFNTFYSNKRVNNFRNQELQVKNKTNS